MSSIAAPSMAPSVLSGHQLGRGIVFGTSAPGELVTLRPLPDYANGLAFAQLRKRTPEASPLHSVIEEFASATAALNPQLQAPLKRAFTSAVVFVQGILATEAGLGEQTFSAQPKALPELGEIKSRLESTSVRAIDLIAPASKESIVLNGQDKVALEHLNPGQRGVLENSFAQLAEIGETSRLSALKELEARREQLAVRADVALRLEQLGDAPVSVEVSDETRVGASSAVVITEPDSPKAPSPAVRPEPDRSAGRKAAPIQPVKPQVLTGKDRMIKLIEGVGPLCGDLKELFSQAVGVSLSGKPNSVILDAVQPGYQDVLCQMGKGTARFKAPASGSDVSGTVTRLLGRAEELKKENLVVTDASKHRFSQGLILVREEPARMEVKGGWGKLKAMATREPEAHKVVRITFIPPRELEECGKKFCREDQGGQILELSLLVPARAVPTNLMTMFGDPRHARAALISALVDAGSHSSVVKPATQKIMQGLIYPLARRLSEVPQDTAPEKISGEAIYAGIGMFHTISLDSPLADKRIADFLRGEATQKAPS